MASAKLVGLITNSTHNLSSAHLNYNIHSPPKQSVLLHPLLAPVEQSSQPASQHRIAFPFQDKSKTRQPQELNIDIWYPQFARRQKSRQRQTQPHEEGAYSHTPTKTPCNSVQYTPVSAAGWRYRNGVVQSSIPSICSLTR